MEEKKQRLKLLGKELYSSLNQQEQKEYLDGLRQEANWFFITLRSKKETREKTLENMSPEEKQVYDQKLVETNEKTKKKMEEHRAETKRKNATYAWKNPYVKIDLRDAVPKGKEALRPTKKYKQEIVARLEEQAKQLVSETFKNAKNRVGVGVFKKIERMQQKQETKAQKQKDTIRKRLTKSGLNPQAIEQAIKTQYGE